MAAPLVIGAGAAALRLAPVVIPAGARILQQIPHGLPGHILGGATDFVGDRARDVFEGARDTARDLPVVGGLF